MVRNAAARVGNLDQDLVSGILVADPQLDPVRPGFYVLSRAILLDCVAGVDQEVDHNLLQSTGMPSYVQPFFRHDNIDIDTRQPQLLGHQLGGPAHGFVEIKILRGIVFPTRKALKAAYDAGSPLGLGEHALCMAKRFLRNHRDHRGANRPRCRQQAIQQRTAQR